MKKIFLSALILSSAISTNSFSMEIQSKLIDHKEWVTGNAKGFFKKNIKLTKDQLLQLDLFKSRLKRNSDNQIDEYINATSVIKYFHDHDHVSTNIVMEFDGVTDVECSNHTASLQDYEASYDFCIFQSGKFAPIACLEGKDQIRLYPTGFDYIISYPALSYIFTEPGDYYVTLTTSVIRNHSTLVFESTRAKAFTVLD